MKEKRQDAVSTENVKSKPAKNKKPNGFVRFFQKIGKKFKEMWSELKKVTWPKFPKVVKQTGIVLSVVLIFLVLLTAIDFGLEKLLGLITDIG